MWLIFMSRSYVNIVRHGLLYSLSPVWKSPLSTSMFAPENRFVLQQSMWVCLFTGLVFLVYSSRHDTCLQPLTMLLDLCVQAAYPGDIIGINNPGHFAIGDTIFTGSTKVRFPGIPSFSPECFAYMRNPNPSKYKNYRKGLDQVSAAKKCSQSRP